MQRTSLPHRVNSVENPDRCWTLNITWYVQACMMNVKLHSMTAEFITVKLFSYFSNRWGTGSQDYKPTPNGTWEGISTQPVSVLLISSAYTTYEVISAWSRSAISATDYVFMVEAVLQSELQITRSWLNRSALWATDYAFLVESFWSLSYRLRIPGWIVLQSELQITRSWLHRSEVWATDYVFLVESFCSLSYILRVSGWIVLQSEL